MRKNKLSHLLEPSFRLYFVFLLLFAALDALFSLPVAVLELAVVVILYLYFRRSSAARQKEILSYIENVTCNMDSATKDTMVNAPLPMVIFRPENDEVIWSNDRFLQITGERDHMFDTKLTAAVPDFSSRWLMEGKTQCPTEVRIAERRFLVFGHLVRTEEQGSRGYLATTYWVDVTDFAQVRDDYYATRPVVAILLVDNYEELMKGATDSNRSAMRSEIDDRLAQWVAPAQGLFCRYERDRYLFVFEERFLAQFQEKRTDTLIGFCVMGGVFSEGIDLVGERLIGALIVGTGLPQVSNERKILMDFYDKKGENGFDYAYRIPGMNKVQQSAGRVIRTVEDRGIIALLDERFLYRESLNLFPREWFPYEVVTKDTAGERAEAFWMEDFSGNRQ